MNRLTEDEIIKFNTLTKAYNKLLECRDTLDVLSNLVKKDFQTPNEIELGYFHNPISLSYEFERQINEMKTSITNFIHQKIDDKFGNLVIDSNDLVEYLGLKNPGYGNEDRQVLQGPFTAQAVIQYIEDKYADEETITLLQLKEHARNALPRLDGFGTEKVSKPEHITVIGKTGIELHSDTYNHYKSNATSAVIKLIHIKLNGVLPSQAEHHDIDIGAVYSDDKIKSLRKYKNGKLKIIFHTVEDMELIRRLLVGCDDD